MTDYVNIFNDSFKLVSQKMTWGAAKKNCESDGAKLASLRNQWSEIYVELLALKFKSPMWIGLNKIEVQDTELLKLKIHKVMCKDMTLNFIIDGFNRAKCVLAL